MKNKLEKNLNILISFRSADEVSEECLKYVDILDLKDPDKGAIGSWEVKNLKKIINKFGNKMVAKIIFNVDKLDDNVYKIFSEANSTDAFKFTDFKFKIHGITCT